MISSQHPRGGVATVEAAFVFPVVAFLILALLVGATAVFRYQEVCYLAHEAARYASVHGTDYQKEVGATAANPQGVYDNAIRPRLMTLDASQLGYSVTWSSSNAPYSVVTDYGKPVGNTVTVTITYRWVPEFYLAAPLTLSASSTLPMSY